MEKIIFDQILMSNDIFVNFCNFFEQTAHQLLFVSLETPVLS